MTLALPSRRAVLAPGPWVRNELWRRARAVPSLDLRFAENKSLVDAVTGQQLVTFTRASAGTYVGSDGLIKTAAENVPRFDHNPVTGKSLGLLVEEQRSNILLNSETLATQSVTVSATAYTLSFYGTGTVTLSGTSTAGPLVGTGANSRVSLTFTPTAGSLTLTVSGTVQYANLEAGSFPTSWVPTTDTAATRSADVASISGSNFGGWYSNTNGTMYSDWTSALNGARSFHCEDAGRTSTERFAQRISSNFLQTEVTSNSVASTRSASGAGAISSYPARIVSCAAYDSSNCITAYKGDVSATATANGAPECGEIFIGSYRGIATQPNAPIARLTYWPQRLSNNVLQAITQ